MLNHNDLLRYSVHEKLVHSAGIAYHSKADFNGFILVLAIVVWIRQEWHVLGKFELTEAMQTKRRIIHFNGSNFVLFVNWFIRCGIFPPSR